MAAIFWFSPSWCAFPTGFHSKLRRMRSATVLLKYTLMSSESSPCLNGKTVHLYFWPIEQDWCISSSIKSSRLHFWMQLQLHFPSPAREAVLYSLWLHAGLWFKTSHFPLRLNRLLKLPWLKKILLLYSDTWRLKWNDKPQIWDLALHENAACSWSRMTLQDLVTMVWTFGNYLSCSDNIHQNLNRLEVKWEGCQTQVVRILINLLENQDKL